MLSGPALLRQAFEHEIYANHLMLKMLASVPDENRSDPRFQRAVNIATHMAACRQSFLEVFEGRTLELGGAFEEYADYDKLDSRFAEMEDGWSKYLAAIDDATVDGRFVFEDGGAKWSLSLEAQVFSLIGHAAYHRGQVVLLVDTLGGTTGDTDYIEWFTQAHPEAWSKVE